MTYNPLESARSYSTVYDNDALGTGHARSMLDSPRSWSSLTKTTGDWLKMDLGTSKNIVGVVMQGRALPDDDPDGITRTQCVTSVGISLSTYGSSWVDVVETASANSDSNTQVTIYLPSVMVAQYVKITVKGYNDHPSMRAAVLAVAGNYAHSGQHIKHV